MPCLKDDFERFHSISGKLFMALYAILFLRVAVWDSIESYKRPLRNAASYVVVLSGMVTYFPFYSSFSCAHAQGWTGSHVHRDLPSFHLCCHGPISVS